MAFNYALPFDRLDFRDHPDLYRVGRGEQGVLLVEPYKSELLPLWRFRTPEVAAESAGNLYGQYLQYRERGDFVGMDMARKFLQMGYTRARRYANQKGGRKYDAQGNPLANPEPGDPLKAESAEVFLAVLALVKEDPEYQRLREAHLSATRQPPLSG
ncbi:MAG TPA: DUF4385 domain-containing protein [Candidatus Thermoplasmatota archaeon]|nr:DUF4385 domain-containing protein [Candidatus Thermoplasmatota archaeon]